MAISVSRRLFTADEYEQMAEAGILHEDDRLELLEGEIVEMTPIGPPHSGCVNQLNRLFTSRIGDRAVVAVQNPIRLGTLSEPQPDVVLLEPRADFYSTTHAGPDDVLLLVEVSSSAPFDRLVKMPLYARYGIRQAWLVDVDAKVVEVYRLTGEGSYGDPELVQGPARVPVDAFPDVSVTAADILGA